MVRGFGFNVSQPNLTLNVPRVAYSLSLGANPFNSSPQGAPETYTDNEAILQLLAEGRDTYVAHTTASENTTAPDAPHEQQTSYPAPPFDPSQGYYRPAYPPGAEHAYGGAGAGYYATEGGFFLIPPQPVDYPPSAQFRGQQQPPPPEITKSIPCR